MTLSGAASATTTADSTANYSFTSLASGAYTVTAAKSGFTFSPPSLPVIVSDEVGAAPDLVDGKGTGIVFPCGDVNALAHALAGLVASLDLRKSLGAAASRLIDDWDVSVCAKDIGIAVHAVAARA